MGITLRAILPKGTLINVAGLEAKLSAALNDFVTKADEELSTYPTQLAASAPVFGKAKRSYKGRPAGRRVLKSGYARTGTLGRSWSWVPAKRVGDSLVASIGSSGQVAPYNVYVQGSKQSRDMARRHWPTARRVVLSLWPPALRQIWAVFVQAGKGSA